MTQAQTRINVLDKGFIELVNVMGDDSTVVAAARVSFAKESLTFDDADAKLIKYLASHGHVSPFYHPQLMFRVKAPISVGRQWFKHKIGTAENSESTRYIEVKDEYYIPEVMRSQSTSNKQGSGANLLPESSAWIRKQYIEACEQSFMCYKGMVFAGVAKEQAREVLPLCTYTSWVWTASLLAVIHFLELREESHAQAEIRSYASAMRKLVAPLFPVSLAAFEAAQ